MIGLFGRRADLICAVFCTALATAQTQPAESLEVPDTARVTILDSHSKEVRWVEQIPDAATGGTTGKEHSYVAVENGQNYRDESGQWQESQDVIELTDDSAISRRGPMQVQFSPFFGTPNTITLTTQSNRVFRSSPVGLYYFDAVSGKSVLIAPAKSSQGELHPPNQVVYPDCLEGLKADYRVTVTKMGMEADLILLQQLPTPESLGLKPDFTRLEWITQFHEAPTPEKRINVLKEQSDLSLRKTMAEPDLADETLDFGDLWFPPGRAFSWESSEDRPADVPAQIRLFSAEADQLSVAKHWLKIDGIDALVESVEWRDIEGKLQSLPKVASVDPGLINRTTPGRRLPEQMVAGRPVRGEGKTMKVASTPYRAKGFVLDYVAVVGGGSYTFNTGVTYLLSSGATFSSITLQSGAIVKRTPAGYLVAYTSVATPAAGAASAILTSSDDNLYGETILGSTGNPTYNERALMVYDIDNVTVQSLKIRWAYIGAYFLYSTGSTLKDTSLEQCSTGVQAESSSSVTLLNDTQCGVVTPTSILSGSTITGTPTVNCGGDADSDGLPDTWEMQYFNSLVHNGTGDADGDGLSNYAEYLAGSNPMQAVVTIGEPLGPSSRRTGLAISEIMYHPAAGVPPPNGQEYVEIYNSDPVSKDISGYGLVALDKNDAVSFQTTFPSGTVLLPGGFFVVGAPGPDSFDDAGGTIRLTNQLGAVLLEVPYSDEAPWPKHADGAGHSLVLVRPSYGEGDPRAWGPSDVRGGSPGKGESYASEPARSVVINEFLANPTSGNADYIELYNHANSSVSVAGYYLSNDPSALNLFQIPAGTTIPANGFVSFLRTTTGETGKFTFNLQGSGDKIYFTNPGQTRVVDSVSFTAQRNGVSMGRSPNGAPTISELATQSRGTSNSGLYNPSAANPATEDIVINEIMYNPISGSDSDEYLELYNKGSSLVTMTGWAIDGVGYTFPTISISSGAYIVVAKNVTNLRTKYPNLNTSNSVGDYSGSLKNKGERIALVNTSGVVIDEVTYHNGGRWGQWSDGGGSSLELMDPRSDNRHAANWVDSNDTSESVWTTVSATGNLDYGFQNNSYACDKIDIIMLGAGECLVDDVTVLVSGNNKVSNSNFEPSANLSNWTLVGNHDQSTLETASGFGGYNSSQCLHVRATGRGDNTDNKVVGNLSSDIKPPAGVTNISVTIQAKVRWLRGNPEILFRLKGNYVETAGNLLTSTTRSVPNTLGTPGQQNSTSVANIGPAIYDVSHSPVLPAAGQPVVVTARALDPDTVASLTLYYRNESTLTPPAFSTLSMVDTGASGDAIASDGVYSATIPAQASGTTIGFYVQAADGFSPSATTKFPNDAPTRECLVRFGEVQPAGTLGVYRIWCTAATINQWTIRGNQHNSPLDTTFVYGSSRVIYNAGARYGGSGYSAGAFNTPTGNLCHYSLSFPEDDRFLGSTEAIVEFPPYDNTCLLERITYWMANEMGLPFNHRRFVHLNVNGVNQIDRYNAFTPSNPGRIYEDTQRPESEFIESWYPTDASGSLFKVEVWNEVSFDIFKVASLENFTTSGGAKKRERYRWNWLKRAVKDSAHDYTTIFALVDAANSTLNYTSQVEALVDTEQWMRTLALERMVGNWDSYGYANGHNLYAYKPAASRWQFLLWDIDNQFGNHPQGAAGAAVSDDLFAYVSGVDPVLYAMMTHPPFERAYLRAFEEGANGPMASAKVGAAMDTITAALIGNGITPIGSTVTAKNWIAGRSSFILQEVGTRNATFEITSNGGNNFTTSQNPVSLVGNAPVSVTTIKVNGTSYTPTWDFLDPNAAPKKPVKWTISVPLNAGANVLTVQSFNRLGQIVATDSITITRSP